MWTEHFDRRCACNPVSEISVWGNVWVTKKLLLHERYMSALFKKKPTLVYEMSLVTLPRHYFMYPPCYYYWAYKIIDHDCDMSSDSMKFVIISCVKIGDHTYTARLCNKPVVLISWSKWAKMDLNECKNICRRSSPTTLLLLTRKINDNCFRK